MKKVVVLKSRASTRGGLEKTTERLILAFQEKGCDVTLLSRQESSLFSFQNVRAFDRFCKKALRTAAVDIVFGMDRTCEQSHLRAGNGVHAAYLERRKKADGLMKSLSFACNPLHRTLLEFEKKAFEYPGLKRLFVNSTMVKDEIVNRFSTPFEKISVLHNGVEWKELEERFVHWQKEKITTLRHLNLPSDQFYFLFVGHNFQRKGLEPLLRGCKEQALRDFHLLVAGHEKNEKYFRALTEKLQLEKHVTFLGNVHDVTPFYQVADALVIPSIYDPFANVTVEALAMGVFVVSSKHNGGHEILTQETGAVIEELFDPASVACALDGAMKRKKNPHSAQNIRASVEHLDFSVQLQKMVDLCLL